MIGKRTVIIGNSAAALSAIQAIRRENSTCPITLISQEDCYAYSPVLTPFYLSDRIQERNLFISDKRFYRGANVICLFGKEAVEIDPRKQAVVLNDDSKVNYDYLLIATGASPKAFDVLDSDTAKGLCYLRTIRNARKIKKLSKQAKEAAIIGAGLVSMEIANALYRNDIHLTFIAGSKQVLSQNVDWDCAAIIREEIEASCDSSILFGRNVNRIDKEDNKYNLSCDTGEEFAADMVIVGKGVVPNTQLVRNSGIIINKGVVVDDRLRTNIENIYAAGDVAEGRNLITGNIEVIPNWVNACEQGTTAGLNIAEVEAMSAGSINENITQFFGLGIAAIGITKVNDEDNHFEELKFMDHERKAYRKLIINGNRLIGAILLGSIQDVGIIRNIIVNSVDISPFMNNLPKIPLDFSRRFLCKS